jgi:hypothetical protein
VKTPVEKIETNIGEAISAFICLLDEHRCLSPRADIVEAYKRKIVILLREAILEANR